MTHQVGASTRPVAEKFHNQITVGLGVVGTAGGWAASVPRPVGHQQLPASFGQSLLGREVAIATDLAPLCAAVYQHHPRPR